MRSGIAAILLVALTVVIFVYGQSVSYAPNVGYGTSIPFRIVSQGPWSYQSSPQQLVINDQVEWSTVWAKTMCIQSAGCSAPSVNFENSTLIAVYAGPTTFINYVVNVTEVRLEGSVLFVATALWVPGLGCPVPFGAHSGSPYQIVTIAKTNLAATFSNRRYVVNCQSST